MKRLFFIFLGLILTSATAAGQTELTLDQVIEQALANSPSALQAENRKENRYWQYRSYLSNYRPQLRLTGSLPDFNRSITPITQPDGTDIFRERSLATSDLTLSLDQTVLWTGGTVFMSSQLQRIDIFGNNAGTSYAANPFQVGFRQPLFAFNGLKWDARIEPLRYEESRRQFIEEQETISIQAANLFFDLLLAQISVDIAEKNVANNDTIYKIGKGRYNLGVIAENDLLQLELNLINSRQQLSQAKLDLEINRLELNTFIGNPGNEEIILIEPKDIPMLNIDVAKAIEEAKRNRGDYVGYERRMTEAERDVARARGDNGLNINLTASFGLTETATTVPSLYQSPQDQQRVRVGFEIPIIDWGRQKSEIKTAVANREVIESTVEQERINFEQEIYVKVKQFDILRLRLIASMKADTVAQRRYFIARKRYFTAKIGASDRNVITITDLNIALQEKDQARQGYLQSLKEFWAAYYEIRQLTLYDFENDERLYSGE